MNSIKFIGMDVHKKSITIAIADLGSRGPARSYGTINNDLSALDKFCRKMVSTASQLHFVYEAGPCGCGKSRWSKAYFNWLSDIAMAHPAQQVALQEYIDTVHESIARVKRLTDQIQQLVPDWRLGPVAIALQAARGVSLIVAVTFLSEMGDLSRFENPSQLMAYLGLVPSEHSSGDRIKRGGITKTGNGHARKVLVQASWAYRMKPRISRILLKRQQQVSKEVRQISWKAQLRLCTRFRRLAAMGKPKQVVVTAIARELSAFLWVIAKQMQPVV